MGEDEYAIVTWGSSGIGKVMIHKFQSEGVVVHSLDIAVDTVGQVMPKNGVIWHKCDVSKANEVNQCIALITKDHPVDILVNNAVIGFIGDFLNFQKMSWIDSIMLISRAYFTVIKKLSQVCSLMSPFFVSIKRHLLGHGLPNRWRIYKTKWIKNETYKIWTRRE
ncbi:MAG: NADP-dependent 3-hydroxy acid dehydrogenase YdfG [Saprospiraceae bacterium]|jgi:NADP-dependent 3-hydroxy acid dehydrogenase YdfG